MLRTILNAFSVADIRKKLAFTAAMLALYRLGAYIPAPGVNVDAVKEISSNFGGSNILGFLNLFSGGSLSRIALFALGVIYDPAKRLSDLQTKRHQEKHAVWIRAMDRWDNLYYCTRCDQVFDPARSKSATVRNMRSLL